MFLRILVSGFFLFFTMVFSVHSQNALNQTNYDVKFYGINISASNTSVYISGNTRIDIEMLEDSDTVIFDMGMQLTVTEVKIDSVSVEFKHEAKKLFVLSDELIKNNIYQIKIYYSGDGIDSEDEQALFNKSDSYGDYTYSLTEPFATKYWMPCKEVLDDKADSVWVYVTVQKDLKVGANGLLSQEKVVHSDSVKFMWQSNYSTAFYLISFAVSNFRDYTIYANIPEVDVKMPVVNYINNSDSYFELNKDNIDATVDLIELFSELFGPYPFYKEKYGHTLVPLGGGMEHQTMTTLGSFSFNLVAHELAHQWFGDYVTCSSWNDIWINEGFASYSEYLANEKILGLESASTWMDYAHQLIYSEIEGSTYIPDDEIWDSHRIFNYQLTYKKGAAIIHMIRYELNNDELFFQVLKEFLKRHAFKNASGEDFRNVLEELSGRSFKTFFDEWYYGSGFPILDVSWGKSNDTLFIYTSQTGSDKEKTDLFHLKLQFKVEYALNDTIIEYELNSESDTFMFFTKAPVYDVVVDPNHYLINRHKITRLFGDDNLKVFFFYPNPVVDEINLFSRDYFKPVNLTFYNSIGKKIKYVSNVDPLGDHVSLSELGKGIYFVYLNSEEYSSVYKIIKK